MQRQQRWIDYTGLNLIRIVIGSYFMAISLGLIDGSDPRVLFLPFFGEQTADLVTTVLLFSVTAAFMLGLYLRLSSLMLAIFMLASSYVTNFMMPEKILIAEFWRDLTLVCAILLCYTCLKRNEVRKAALVWRRRSERVSPQDTVVPRRVPVPAGSSPKTERGTPAAQYQASLEPLISRKRPIVAQRKDQSTEAPPPYAAVPLIRDSPRPDLRQVKPAEEDEPVNIFASI